MQENKSEEARNTSNPIGTIETDYTENDLLSSKTNNGKTENKNLDDSKIYSNKEVFDLEFNQGFTGKFYFWFFLNLFFY